MTDSSPPQFRLPDWGWFLLATVILVIVGIGLSIWLPYHREQQVIQRFESSGRTVFVETCGAEWLCRLLGKDRIQEFKVFERVCGVYLDSNEVTDTEIADLSRLTNLRQLSVAGPARKRIKELIKACPNCAFLR